MMAWPFGCGQLLYSIFLIVLCWPTITQAIEKSKVRLHGVNFEVELATGYRQMARGLMYRKHLDADKGMLFVYSRPTPTSFWMKNTLIPLDILYFDKDRKLVKMYSSVPPCTQSPCVKYPANQPVRFILELNGGTAKRVGVEVGDVLAIFP